MIWRGAAVRGVENHRLMQTLAQISGPNPRYFGQERGVTFYNLVSDQFTGPNGIIVPGTLRDSLVLLSVVLEQQTELQPTEIMTDTGAYTDTMFGIFHLLGYQFSPRLADIGGSRFWRVDQKADYGANPRKVPDAGQILAAGGLRSGLPADRGAGREGGLVVPE
jgi:TnpA family transposase